jgi:hypothetical protein
MTIKVISVCLPQVWFSKEWLTFRGFLQLQMNDTLNASHLWKCVSSGKKTIARKLTSFLTE